LAVGGWFRVEVLGFTVSGLKLWVTSKNTNISLPGIQIKCFEVSGMTRLQEYLTYKKTHHPETLPKAYA
jgi:hypothetical protein